MNSLGERRVYFIMMSLLYLALLGLPAIRYIFYVLPPIALIIWLSDKDRSINFNAAPFVLLLIASVPSIYDIDVNSFKMSYFTFVYAFVFSIFDFSKIEISFKKCLMFLVFIFLFNILLQGGGGRFSFSIANSESTFESTLAFPVGLIALYFFIAKKYLYSFLSLALCLLMLKRIVILALIISLFPKLCGVRVQRLIVNPYVVTIAGTIVTVLIIEFSKGSFDNIFVEYLDQSANQFSKGRQQLWAATLDVLKFNYQDFIFWGVGQGKVTTLLDKVSYTKDIRLHSDLLLLLLQFGIVVFVLFLFLLNKHKSIDKRTVSLFLTMLLVTDNVLVYQHVMVFYFLILSQIERIDRNSATLLVK